MTTHRSRHHWRMAAAAAALLAATQPALADACTSGRRQSPIDIVQTQPGALPPLALAYADAPLKLADDGHTLRVRLAGAGELRIGPTRYRLQQVHFHTPAGDQVAGETFPMAAHVLHKGPGGELLALLVLFRVGAPHPWLDRLLPHLPPRGRGDQLVPDARINASGLLPAGHGYWRYTGSETAPPCAEGVQWIVLRQPVELSAAQLAQYRARFADNARAVQPLNGRVVLESR